ncbi:DNA polymerase III subunit delta [uncultured Acidaminococcus sp.]|uniref:DNA polymerase III subunit delta n=1 Tax=uncultured Acidaminococcus sp. TaxID=352152 RepID=UPI002666756B|nr:DNA polymerase III subunit delta [uncultured Acidaminococcus sp.]
MNYTADVFLENLRKNSACPHVVIAWGEEEYYKKTIQKAFRQKAFASGEEPTEWDFQGDFALNALEEATNSMPFFGGGNWIVIEDPRFLTDKEKASSQKTGAKGKKKKMAPIQQFITLLTDMPEYSFLICLCSKLDKRQSFYKIMSQKVPIVECSPLRPYQLQPWLRQQADRYGARFTPEAMSLIMEYVSATDTAPLLFLQQEISKIALYAGERKLWQAQDVGQMFSQLPEISGFALGNAVEERKLGKVLLLLAEEKKNSGSDGFYNLTLRLVSSLRRMLQVKELMEKGARQETIASTLKMHPYAVKMAMQHSNHYSCESLQTCMVELARMTAESRKSGRTWSRLEEILVKLVSERKKNSIWYLKED